MRGSIDKFRRAVYTVSEVWSVGYSQGAERTDIRDGGSADCSSQTNWAARAAGFDIGAATYTGNMRHEYSTRGWQVLDPGVEKHPGDILLADHQHVAVYLGPAMVGGRIIWNAIGEAVVNEHGGIIGGAPGDQTGGETHVRSYYDFPWDCVLRAPAHLIVDNDPDPARVLTPELAFPTGSAVTSQTPKEAPDMELTDKIKRPDGHVGSVHDVLAYVDQRVETMARQVNDLASTVSTMAKTVAAILANVQADDHRDAVTASRVRDIVSGTSAGTGRYQLISEIENAVLENSKKLDALTEAVTKLRGGETA